MRLIIGIAATLVVSACAGEADTSEELSVSTIDLQPIGYPDIQENDLFGMSCAYGSGNSMAALVIAMPDAAYIKTDGALIAVPAAEGSAELSYGSRSEYSSEDYVLRLAQIDEGVQVAPELINYVGEISLNDADGAELFTASGTVQCGA